MTTFNLPILHIVAEAAARSLVLGLLAAAGLRLLRVCHARLEKQAWTGVLLLAIAMPLLVALRIPRLSVPALWATPQVVVVPNRTAAVQSRTLPAPAIPTPASGKLALLPPVAAKVATPGTAPIPLQVTIPGPNRGPGPGPDPLRSGSTLGAPFAHLPFPWELFGVAVYTLVSAMLLLRVLLGLVLAIRMWRRADVFATQETALPVRLTAEVDSPVTLGHGILLPLDAENWDISTLRTTLAHEAAHIRAGDFYLQLGASLHLALFWISPLAWWLPAQLSRLSETICDRAAVQATGDGLRYAQVLLRFATHGRAPAGMLAMAQSAGLRERIEQLIADPELASAFRHRRGQAAGALLLLGLAAVASAATVRILAPQSVVLAAPQAPAAPAVAAPTAPAAPAVAPPAPPSLPAPASASEPLPAPEAPPALGAPGSVVTPAVNSIGESIPSVDPVVSIDTQVQELPPLDRVIPGDPNAHRYAIYGPDGHTAVMMHGWFDDGKGFTNEKAQHPGGAIVFERDGKSYVIDDPALVKQAREAYAPVEQLGKQQGELGEKQGALGDQQGRLGDLQGTLGEQEGKWGEQQAELAEKFDFKMPEGFDAAVEKLVETASRLAVEQDSLTAAQRADLEAQHKEAQANFNKMMAEFNAHQPQREAWEKQMREQSEQMRKQMEPMIKQIRELAARQGELGRQQAELGRHQALLGREQRRASREADQKVQQLIDQAIRDGKAKSAQ